MFSASLKFLCLLPSVLLCLYAVSHLQTNLNIPFGKKKKDVKRVELHWEYVI